MLHYQETLPGNPPSVKLSLVFLARLREQHYSASTLKIHRAALKGPGRHPAYINANIISRMLEPAKNTPRDYLILLLLSQAGIRRDKAVKLEVVNVAEKPYVSEVKRIKIAQFP